jgi:probable F420-dependent oxidoreductase
VLGIGTSSNIIVERWNGMSFADPYKRVRDTVRFLREALTGEKVSRTYDTFAVGGFRLGASAVPEQPVPILVAALREGMLNLAGREGDGAIINWLSADDVATVAPIVTAHGADKEVVARIFVVPSEDTDTVRAQARYAVAAYVNVPVYAAFHEWLGRGPLLQPVWDAWRAGDRAAALEAIPDQVVDELVVHGSYDECRAHIQRYLDNGVTTPALAVLPMAGVDVREAVRRLAPG